MSVPPLVASRRTTVAAGLAGLVALSGCDLDPGPDEPTSEQTTAPPVDADSELVEQVRTRILAALGAVATVRSEGRKLRQTLRPLADLHGAHLAALDSEGLDEDLLHLGEPGPGLARVRAAETTLQRQLTTAAIRAESGALAKLLASMAAAVAQHLAALR